MLTGEREVNAMLDLVKPETEQIDSRFLEPACGTGNFLAEILKRKLRVVEDRYAKSQIEYERKEITVGTEMIDKLWNSSRKAVPKPSRGLTCWIGFPRT
ncbi:hypothetical protein [Rectinema subterraneum]|uniref:hypothetical protein n=1 Tax=Rectinema subterraneum TaxID=2653714 RepID=UPI001C92CF31|nr:hypothetical protein [Rectinema subterraneum]